MVLEPGLLLVQGHCRNPATGCSGYVLRVEAVDIGLALQEANFILEAAKKGFFNENRK